MLWKQMLCRLTTHHWPSPTILPLSHKHSLSLACSITYFSSFVLFGTHTNTNANTQQNLDTHEVALFVNKSRVLCWVCGLRKWEREGLSITDTMCYKSGCCQNCGFVDYAHGWSTYELKGIQGWVWLGHVLILLLYCPFNIQLNRMINYHCVYFFLSLLSVFNLITKIAKSWNTK